MRKFVADLLSDKWLLTAILTQLLLLLWGAVVTLKENWAKDRQLFVLSVFFIFGVIGFIATAMQASESAATNTKLQDSLDKLGKATNEIGKKTALNTRLQEQLLDQGHTISTLAQTSVNTVTGGNSFCFMTLAGDKKTLLIYNPGEYALTDVALEIQDYTLRREDRSQRQTVIPHASQPYRYELTEGDREDFLITFGAVNGAWWETLQLRKVDGVWRQALKVERFPKRVKLDGTTPAKIIRQDVEPLYPGAAVNNVQWCKFVTSKPRSEPNPNPCIPSS